MPSKTKTSAAPSEAPFAKNLSVWVAGGLVGLALLVAGLIWFFRAPPQMGADPDVFQTVDALYTAVRSENPARVERCAERLAKYRDEGKLPVDSADHLDAIVARARAGDWRSATRRLYDFMIAQRREGEVREHEPRKKPTVTNASAN